MAEKRKTYHTFKRRDVDGNVFELECLVEKAPSVVTLKVLETHIIEALKRGGQADGQNCAGAVCVEKSKNAFKHPVSVLIDWWRNRVYVHTGTKNKMPRCTVYGHYDKIESLFDGEPSGLARLLKRVQKAGHIDVALFPVVRGFNPRTGRKTNPSGPSGPGGPKQRPKGNDLRQLSYLKARGLLPLQS